MKQDMFRVLKTIHLALLMGMVLLVVLSAAVRKAKLVDTVEESVERNLQLVAVLISVAALVTGFNTFKKKILAARNSVEPAESRMHAYRAACLLWWAMMEGAGLFALMGFIITGNYAFLALGFFHLLVLVVFIPRKSNIIVLLKLNQQEVARLEGK